MAVNSRRARGEDVLLVRTVRLARDSDRRGRPITPAPPTPYLSVKAGLDRVLGVLLLVALAPIIGLSAALVRLSSRGSAFYAQTRLGLGGRPFTVWKLRTMVHNCERLTGPRWCSPGDPRVTPLGHLLRKTHLDELPQLWNVVKGEMSLIGPRPERPEFLPSLEAAYPCYRDRLAVRPGITGLAQVQLPPDSDIEGVGKKLACDLAYIGEVSFGLDVRLIGATVLHVLGADADATVRLLRLPTAEPLAPQEAASLAA